MVAIIEIRREIGVEVIVTETLVAGGMIEMMAVAEEVADEIVTLGTDGIKKQACFFHYLLKYSGLMIETTKW